MVCSPEYCHLVACVPWFDDSPVVVIYGQSGNDTAVRLFSQDDDSVVYLTPAVCLYHPLFLCLGNAYDGVVAVLPYENDVRLVDDDFLLIESLAYEYCIRACGMFRCALYGCLYALPWRYDSVIVSRVVYRLAVEGYCPVLVASLCLQGYTHSLPHVILLCPPLITAV